MLATSKPDPADHATTQPCSISSLFVTAQDGLRLHVRCYRPAVDRGPADDRLPVVCLPGLARTAADFEEVAIALSTDSKRPRTVLALDYRGRGKSDYDRRPANYNLQVELADVLTVLTALEIPRAVFVGTSRGGILAMLLASARPSVIVGCVLNDIGPVIELKGLMRIKSYVGKLPRTASIHEGAAVLRRLFGTQFPKWTDDDWVAYARRTFKEVRGRILPDYDVKLSTTLKGVKPDRPPAPLWNAFDALAGRPVLVVHGGNSDILAAATVEAMRGRHRGLDVVEVPDEGHAPRLSDAAIVNRIAAFVVKCEEARVANSR